MNKISIVDKNGVKSDYDSPDKYLHSNSHAFKQKRLEIQIKYTISIPENTILMRFGKEIKENKKYGYPRMYFFYIKDDIGANMDIYFDMWKNKCNADQYIWVFKVKKNIKLLPMSMNSYTFHDIENTPKMKEFLNDLIELINLSNLNETEKKYLKNAAEYNFGIRTYHSNNMSNFFSDTNPDYSLDKLYHWFDLGGWVRMNDEKQTIDRQIKGEYEGNEIMFCDIELLKNLVQIEKISCGSFEYAFKKIKDNFLNVKQPPLNLNIFRNHNSTEKYIDDYTGNDMYKIKYYDDDIYTKKYFKNYYDNDNYGDDIYTKKYLKYKQKYLLLKQKNDSLQNFK